MKHPTLTSSFEPATKDFLKFEPYAKKVQNIIRGLSNTSESIVIGIDGEWGSGKSTFSNMLFYDLESFKRVNGGRRIIKMRYNPWMYSGSEEMLFDFLNQMKKSFYRPETNKKKIGDAILKYSKYLKSVRISGKIGLGEMVSLGVSVEPEEILKKLGGEIANAGDGLIELKEQVNELLEKSDIKLVVFIDDLDRLDKDELFTILKLVKLTAGFSHVVFVICMDFEMVANSIFERFGSSKEDGNKYLEKIVNIPITLPLIENVDRKEFVAALVNKCFDQYQFVELVEKNMLLQSLHLCDFKTPREAIRVANSFTYALFAIGTEVNAHDLFWMEYFKIKCPALYNELKSVGVLVRESTLFQNRILLNDPSDMIRESDTNRDRLLKEYETYSGLLDMLFPMDRKGTVNYITSSKQEPVEKLNREKRISHIDHYEKYFSFHTQRKVSVIGLHKLTELIKSGNHSDAKEQFDILKDASSSDIIVLRLLIDALRQPQDTGKVPVYLFAFLSEYNDAHQLDSVENIGIFEVVRELVTGLESNDTDQLKWIEKLCETTNIQIALSFASIIASGLSIDIAKPMMKTLVQRIVAYKEKTYFELLDSNPYYLHLYWAENDKESFEKYIKERIETVEHLGHFLKLFVHYWNGNIRGIFSEKAFGLVKVLINVNILNSKIGQLLPDIIAPADFSNYDDYSNNHTQQLAEQFLFWSNKNQPKEK